VYRALCPSKSLPKPRLATIRSLYGPTIPGDNPVILDSESLVLYFPGPKSVTGEDIIELHVHGGPATVKAVLAAVAKCQTSHGRIRYAEPGEFTKRAFVNDRLDLAQVESLSDTLAAETEQQRRAAVRGNSGTLGRTYEGWRQQLLLARGELEALIDFSEDQHFDESQAELLGSVSKQVEDMLRSIQQHELGSQRSELLRNGIRIALLGPPNVGKSSLMNLIVGREASIVSGEAGTTRDIVEASLDIGGYLCSFADTAGFRSQGLDGSEKPGAIEEEGIRRARKKALESDVIVVLASVESDGGATPMKRIHFDEETIKLAAQAKSCLVVINKRDEMDGMSKEALENCFKKTLREILPRTTNVTPLAISCRQAETSNLNDRDPGGIHGLTEALIGVFRQMTDMPTDQQDLLGVTARQEQLLLKCRQHLEEFMDEAQPEDADVEADIVLAAEYLRYAADCLARITGKGEGGDVEDVLGVVFEK
jgi:tRNA modification GTPase